MINPKDNIGSDYVSSIEESEKRQSTDTVNENDNAVSGWYASTCSCDKVYDISDTEDGIITEYSIVWFNTNKIISKAYFVCTSHLERTSRIRTQKSVQPTKNPVTGRKSRRTFVRRPLQPYWTNQQEI